MGNLLYLAGIQKDLFKDCVISDTVLHNIVKKVEEHKSEDDTIYYGVDITECDEDSVELDSRIESILSGKFKPTCSCDCWEVCCDNNAFLYHDNLVAYELCESLSQHIYNTVTVVGARLECEVLASVSAIFFSAECVDIVVDLDCCAYADKSLAEATVKILTECFKVKVVGELR